MRKVFIFILLLVLPSCSTLKKCTKNQDIIKLTNSNFNLLTGKYIDESWRKKDSTSCSLSWDIFDKGLSGIDSLKYTEIKVISSSEIIVQFYDGHSISRSKVFKGYIKDGYFVLKRKFLVIPAIIFNVFRNRSFRIGLLRNNNIITDYHQITFGTDYVFLPIYSIQKDYNIEFIRIK